MYCNDANTVLVAGSSIDDRTRLVRSTDGGKTWKDVTISLPVVKTAVTMYTPTISPTTPSRTKAFRISGSMRPGLSGSIKVMVYRKGSTRVYTSRALKLVNRGSSSTYSWSLKLAAGKWTVKTYFAGDSRRKPGTSLAKGFTVR